MGGRMVGRRVATAFVVVILLASTQCQAPTQMTLAVTTDVACTALKGVTITVGQAAGIDEKAPVTSTTNCTDGDVGTLVVIPNGSKSAEVAIKVVGGNGRDAESCLAPTYGTGCIVARRV